MLKPKLVIICLIFCKLYDTKREFDGGMVMMMSKNTVPAIAMNCFYFLKINSRKLFFFKLSELLLAHSAKLKTLAPSHFLKFQFKHEKLEKFSFKIELISS